MGRYKFRIAGSADTAPSGGGTYYDGEVPEPSVYRTKMKRLHIEGPNKNKDDMLVALCEIAEPDKKNGKSNPKAQYNGYGIWGRINLTDDNVGRVNQFLMAISGGKKQVLKDWWGGGPRVDDNDKPNILAVGTFKIDPTGMDLIVNATNNEYKGKRSLQASQYLLPTQLTSTNTEADEDEEEDIDEVEDIEEELEDEDEEEDIEDDDEDEDDDDEDEDEGDEEEESDEETARQVELEALSLAAVKRAAKEVGLGLADYRGKDKEEIVDLILDAEFPAEDAEEEEPEPEPEPEPAPARQRRTRSARATKPAAATKAAPARRGRSRRGPSF